MNQLLVALAVLAGIGQDMSRTDATRIARQHGFVRRGSGGSIRHALNLKGRPAFNEYRERPGMPPEEYSHERAKAAAETRYRQNRNAAKARRRALREVSP